MARKFIQLALLIAGLFLSKANAAGECLAYAGSILQASEFQGSSCPDVTFTLVGPVQCELVKTGDFVCVEVGSGGSIGGPYKYTGGIFDQLPDGDFDNQLIPVSPISVGDAATSSVEQVHHVANHTSGAVSRGFTQSAKNQAALSKNDKIINDNISLLRTRVNQIHTELSGDAEDIRIISARNDFNIVGLTSDVLALDDKTEEVFKVVQAIEKNPVHTVTHQKLDELALLNSSFDSSLTNILEEIQVAQQWIGDPFTTTALHSELMNAVQSSGGLSSSQESILNSVKLATEGSNTKLQSIQSSNTAISSNTNSMKKSLSNLEMALVYDQFGDTGFNLAGSLNSLDSKSYQQNLKLDTAIDRINESRMDNNARLEDLYSNQDYWGDIQQTQNQQIIDALGSSTGGGTSDLTETNSKLDAIGQGIDGISDAMKPGTGQNSGPTNTCTGESCWKEASWIESDYPDGIAGIWEERKIAFGGSAMNGYLETFVPNLGGGTVAPLQLCFDTGLANFGCHDFSIPPYVIAFIRLCILISAGFYCQRLVFGGA